MLGVGAAGGGAGPGCGDKGRGLAEAGRRERPSLGAARSCARGLRPCFLPGSQARALGSARPAKVGALAEGPPSPADQTPWESQDRAAARLGGPGHLQSPAVGSARARGQGAVRGRPGASRGVLQLWDPLKASARSPAGLGMGGEGQVGEAPLSVGDSRLETEHRPCKSSDLKRHLQKPNYGAD